MSTPERYGDGVGRDLGDLAIQGRDGRAVDDPAFRRVGEPRRDLVDEEAVSEDRELKGGGGLQAGRSTVLHEIEVAGALSGVCVAEVGASREGDGVAGNRHAGEGRPEAVGAVDRADSRDVNLRWEDERGGVACTRDGGLEGIGESALTELAGGDGDSGGDYVVGRGQDRIWGVDLESGRALVLGVAILVVGANCEESGALRGGRVDDVAKIDDELITKVRVSEGREIDVGSGVSRFGEVGASNCAESILEREFFFFFFLNISKGEV